MDGVLLSVFVIIIFDIEVLKTYIFRSAFPTTIATIELSSDAADSIETFEVTWRYQHFEPSGVSF